jgi:uncharacterized protein YdhG (YjbR/CyaY superfamily)
MTTDERVARYLAAVPDDVRVQLDQLRAVVRRLAPDASETINYGIPTFFLRGRAVVHVAAWERHLSLYPVPSTDEAMGAELAPYRSGRGTLRFPIGRPLPLELIERVVQRLIEERGGAPGKGTSAVPAAAHDPEEETR